MDLEVREGGGLSGGRLPAKDDLRHLTRPSSLTSRGARGEVRHLVWRPLSLGLVEVRGGSTKPRRSRYRALASADGDGSAGSRRDLHGTSRSDTCMDVTKDVEGSVRPTVVRNERTNERARDARRAPVPRRGPKTPVRRHPGSTRTRYIGWADRHESVVVRARFIRPERKAKGRLQRRRERHLPCL